MNLSIDYNGLLCQAVLRTDDSSSRAWMAIVDLALSIQDDATIHAMGAQMHWFSILRAIPQIARLRMKYGFKI